MEAFQSLMIANIAIWFGIGAYCLFLAKKQNNLEKQIQTLSEEE